MAEQKANGRSPSNSREKVKEIIAGIESSIQALFQSEKYFDYLRTMSRFHSYSFNNTILIHMQMPNATHVAGFNKWKDQFGRYVKKGEHGITIIAPTPFRKKIEEQKLDPDTKAPMLDENGQIITEERVVEIPLFRPVKVFDVSQTDGKPLPTLAENLTGDVRQYEIFMEALRRSSPVPITVEKVSPGMDGYFDPIKQRIAIREGMSEVQTVCATVHEIAHSKLHNREQEQIAAAAGSEDPPKPKDRNTEEVEAESVSYAVCSYYGIETAQNSIGYIAGWSSGRDLKELKASLDTITKTVNSLITDIDRHFAEICKERGVDLTQPAQDTPDTPERLAADVFDYMNQLYEAGMIRDPLGSIDRAEAENYYLTCILHGNFNSIRGLIESVRSEADTPTATKLLLRLEKLNDEWDKSLSYEIKPYIPNSSLDRAYIEAQRQAADGFQFKDMLFVGTNAECSDLVQRLEAGSITVKEVKEMETSAWPSPKIPTAEEAELQGQREVAQWEADEIVSFTVTTHEVKPPYPLEKEDAQPAEHPEQPGQDEAVFLVNDAIYLHIQQTDTGVDYSFYDKVTMQLLDGGQIDTDDAAPDFMDTALTEVLSSHAITPQRIEPVSLDMVETLQDAQQMPPALLDQYPMPDLKTPSSGLRAYGYKEDDLIPVGHETAQAMFDKDVPLYIAGSSGCFNMAFEPEELDTPGICIFAIPRDEWESSEDFRQAVAERMDRQEEREAAFLNHGGDCFAIYQLRYGDETRDLRYMPLPGQGVDKQFYELAYTGTLTEQDAGDSVCAALENLFQRFNVNHPADYQRPSMSVSDIVALKQNGVITCHYVDRFAFTELHGFLPQDNPLKNAEMSMEDDYNMIDGAINNGPKEGPTVAELETQVKAGQTISLMDLANAVQRESGAKKSVLKKLKNKQPKANQKRTAPKKSAERER